MASGRRGTATGLANCNELLLSIKHKYWIDFPKMGVEITNASKCHPELVSGSHCEPILMLHRGQMLKRVQHDHQLWSFVFCYIEEHKKQVIEWSQTSRLITHNSQLKNMFFCSSIKKESACHHPHLSKYKKKGFWEWKKKRHIHSTTV